MDVLCSARLLTRLFPNDAKRRPLAYVVARFLLAFVLPYSVRSATRDKHLAAAAIASMFSLFSSYA